MKKNVQKLSMNDFSVNKVIGEGAYGRAILCKAKSDNSLVVIKEIALSNMSAQEQREAWKETKVLSLLSHPNIISYRGCFMEKNCLHIVMEYADGGDLFLQIQSAKNKHFEENQILEWFVQICLALKHVHDRKILHRDIKCQNIFLTKKGLIKMGDFGIAKILDHTSQLSKTAIGTPYYLSPEICQGKAYNMKSDVWSLGCVLYELCTLQHAFDSKCMNGLIMKILRSKQKPIPFTYSQNLRNLVDSLLQKDPRKRPSVNQILKMDFVKPRIEHLLSCTLKKIEFSHTVFHGAKGGETPKDILAEAQKAANAEPDVVSNQNVIQKPQQRISSANGNPPAKPPTAAQAYKQQQQQQQIQQHQQPVMEKPKVAQNPPGRPPAQNEIPKMQQRPPPKIQHGLPVNKNPQRNPNSAAVGIAPPSRNQVQNQPQPAVKAFKPKPPRELEKKQSKDEILASKQANVIAERQRQKEMREKKALEEKEQEERNERKRAELMEKKAKREAERKAQMEHLKQDARERKKKYDNLEAPFKKAMGGAIAPPSQPPPSKPKPANNAQPSAPGGERPLPKYRESYFDDDELPPDAFPSEEDAQKAHPAARPKPKLPDKKPAIRPDHVRNREEDQKSLRELMARKRAELRQQKLAEAKAQKEMDAKIAALKAQQAEQQSQQPQASPPPAQTQPQPEVKKEEPPKPAPKPEQPKKPEPAPVQPQKQPQSASTQPNPEPKKEELPKQAPKTDQPKKVAPAPAPTPVSDETQKKLLDLIDISSSDSEGDDNEMISLYAVVKNILDHPPTSDEENEEEDPASDGNGDKKDENNEEDDQKAKQQQGVFIFNNKELKLPMVTDNDSLHYRVEALRLFIEQNLGLDKFIEVYRFITVDSDNMTDEEGGDKVKQILSTPEELSYYPLIQQLVFCEESL